MSKKNIDTFDHLSSEALEFQIKHDFNPSLDNFKHYVGTIGKDILVLTPYQKDAVDLMWDDTFYSDSSWEGDCRSTSMLGPPGSGKTTAWKIFIKRVLMHRPEVFEPPDKNLVHKPFPKIMLDGKVSIKGFHKLLQYELGFNGQMRTWDKEEYKNKTHELLELCGVQAILVDEGQWLTAGRKDTILEGTGLIKGLADKTQIPVFFAISTADGTETDKGYQRWGELLGDIPHCDRSPPIYLHPFNEPDDPDFIEFLWNIEPHYPFPKRSNLEALAPFIFASAQARNRRRSVTLRGVVKVLSEASVIAWPKDDKLSKKVFKAVAERYIRRWPPKEVLDKIGGMRKSFVDIKEIEKLLRRPLPRISRR